MMSQESRQYVVDSKQGKAKGFLSTVYRLLSTKAGFSLVELMITMVVFLIVIAAASGILTGMITQFKQQSKIAETNIEGAIGLEMMRRDIEHAGYGLPWSLGIATYSEALNDGNTVQNETGYNDSTSNPPRAFVSGNGEGSGNSDVLVIKAMNVAIWANGASSKWTHLFNGNTVREWTPTTERLETSDRVIVLRTDENRTLVVSGGSFTTRYAENGAAADNLVNAAFAPTDNTETRVVYGVTPLATADVTTALWMPFNRTDYYVRTPATMPTNCANGTGILYKATVNQSGMTGVTAGGLNELPILDCVADMQVGFGVDTDTAPDGVPNCYVNNLGAAITADAGNIRSRVKEVRVYILAHEGQYDRDFTFTPPILPSSIRVGEPSANLPGGICTAETVLGRDFDLAGITNWQNYRWKVYTLVVKPNNLR
ncbi:MAG: PilW family protein [Thermodesulfovibrionales bacterium]|nr:PilW family protein [Thermodesulfovibrionales bacterium]